MVVSPTSGIKILGERSTGTNFLSAFLSQNFEVVLHPSSPGIDKTQKSVLPRVSFGRWVSRRAAKEALQDDNHDLSLKTCGGWKHAAATEQFISEFALPSNRLIVCLVRHPVTWSRSMHLNPFHGFAHVPRNYSKFIRAPWICTGRDSLIPRLRQNALTMYRDKVETYKVLNNRHANTVVLRYEDVLKDPYGSAQRLNLTRLQKQPELTLPKKSARSFGKAQLDLDGYQEKARSSGYANLQGEDLLHFKQVLQGSFLNELYPFS